MKKKAQTSEKYQAAKNLEMKVKLKKKLNKIKTKSENQRPLRLKSKLNCIRIGSYCYRQCGNSEESRVVVLYMEFCLLQYIDKVRFSCGSQDIQQYVSEYTISPLIDDIVRRDTSKPSVIMYKSSLSPTFTTALPANCRLIN